MPTGGHQRHCCCCGLPMVKVGNRSAPWRVIAVFAAAFTTLWKPRAESSLRWVLSIRKTRETFVWQTGQPETSWYCIPKTASHGHPCGRLTAVNE